jgi:hypothetical protein
MKMDGWCVPLKGKWFGNCMVITGGLLLIDDFRGGFFLFLLLVYLFV